MNQEHIFKLMIDHQRAAVGEHYRLTENDIRRISRYIKADIFNTRQCVLWDGYINQKGNKTQYAKISFRGKKVLLHRLLYHNFIGDVSESDEILYTCKNRGKCCTLAHLQLRSKNASKEEQPKPKKLTNDDIINIYNDKDNYSRKDLARKHGVSLTTVRNIILGNIYSGITNSEGPVQCTIKNTRVTVSFD